LTKQKRRFRFVKEPLLDGKTAAFTLQNLRF